MTVKWFHILILLLLLGFSFYIFYPKIENFLVFFPDASFDFAPEQFQSLTPYIVGIVELKGGLRLPGMIRNIKPDEIKIKMDLKIDFDTSTSSHWPTWNRYFFRPL